MKTSVCMLLGACWIVACASEAHRPGNARSPAGGASAGGAEGVGPDATPCPEGSRRVDGECRTIVGSGGGGDESEGQGPGGDDSLDGGADGDAGPEGGGGGGEVGAGTGGGEGGGAGEGAGEVGGEGEGEGADGAEGEGEAPDPPAPDGWGCLLLEATDEACSDGEDNDGNGFIDCEDFHCVLNPFVGVCAIRERSDPDCSDGLDNDGDGASDCDDVDCLRSPWVSTCERTESTNVRCSDGLDNDGDGHFDCDDSNCVRSPFVSICGDPCPEGGGGDPPISCPYPLLIHKVFHNPRNDETAEAFIELTGQGGASLQGLELRYWVRLAAADDPPGRTLRLDGRQMADDGYYVIAHPQGALADVLDHAVEAPEFDINVQNSGGYLQLYDRENEAAVDGLGWGELPDGNHFGEGAAARSGGNGDGMSRKSFVDTDDNARDFGTAPNPAPRGDPRPRCD